MVDTVLNAALERGIVADAEEAGVVRALSLDGYMGAIKNLRGIESFGSLEYLSVALAGPASLKPLAALQKLVSLRIVGGKPKDLHILSELPNLRHLELSSMRLKTLEGLASPSLEWIQAYDCGLTAPLAGLDGDCPALRGLRLQRNGMKELVPLPFPLLELLDLSDTKVKSLDGVQKATHLSHLTIDRTTIKDLTPLGGNTALIEFSAGGCKSLRSLEGLDSPSLRSLEIGQTKVKKLDPIDASILTYLGLVHTGLEGKVQTKLSPQNPTGTIFGDPLASPPHWSVEIQGVALQPKNKAQALEMLHWLPLYGSEPPRRSLTEIPPSTTLRHLVVGNPGGDKRILSLEGVERFPNLRTLHSNMPVDSFQPLKQATQLLSLKSGAAEDGDMTVLDTLDLRIREIPARR